MKILALAAFAALLSSAPLAAAEFRGLIAYSECAEDGKTTERAHANCAKDKDRDYQVLVFFNAKDKKIYEVIDESEVEPFLGKEVVIEGDIDDDFILIDSIKAASP